jgi:predicted transcriptional regulator
MYVRKYRYPLDIINQITEILIKSDQNKTKIKYMANLTSRQIRHYIPLMIWMGHIEFNENTKRYKITEKGAKYIEFQKKMEPYLDRLVAALTK